MVDGYFFEQIKAEAQTDVRVVQTALANPFDKFELGIRRLIEEIMINRMAGNDEIVTRYMSDQDFQGVAFPVLAKEIYESIKGNAKGT
jgi:type I restriction enzyme R subunit